jgi:hypothetical protein
MRSMKRNYDYLRYSLPTETAGVYSQKAIKILREIQDQYPDFYIRFRCPSEVLTLSGVRAFDTYYELGADAKPSDIRGLKALLKKHNILLLEHTFPMNGLANEQNDYSIVNVGEMLKTPERYGYVPFKWVPPHFELMENDRDFFLWWAMWKQSIEGDPNMGTLMAEWFKNDHLAAHNVTFGMLLGYPGEAICSALYETEEDYDQGLIQQANIQCSNVFDGAVPIYSYHKELSDNRHIVAHQKLWSDILKNVYAELEPEAVAMSAVPDRVL